MSRKLSWPFIALIAFSFVVGAVWGFKLIHDRKAEEGRLVSEAKLHILAPPGIFSKELLLEFQRREKIEVELSDEPFPGSLLRRALKSAPGQFDAAVIFHYQVSALRVERRLAPLYDARVKFPIAIAPDFRKLPNDRNLMDTAPLLWGLLGLATKKDFDRMKSHIAFWPSTLIGLEDINMQPNAFAAKLQPSLGNFEEVEARLKKGLGFESKTPPAAPLIISHGSLAYSPLKEAGFTFEALRAGQEEVYPMWILTLAALNEGDLERTRKFVKFLLEPSVNVALVQESRFGATTLRDDAELAALSTQQRSSFFRTFPIDRVLLERDERIRAADEVLEQMILGAAAKIVKSVEPARPTPTTAMHTHDDHEAPPAPVAKRKKAPPKPPVESSGDEAPDVVEHVETSSPPSESSAPTAPSEDSPHVD